MESCHCIQMVGGVLDASLPTYESLLRFLYIFGKIRMEFQALLIAIGMGILQYDSLFIHYKKKMIKHIFNSLNSKPKETCFTCDNHH